MKSARSYDPMASFRTLDDIDVRGKRVLLRADLNVPVKDGVPEDREGTRHHRAADPAGASRRGHRMTP
jgi:hypothetical protein